MSTETTHVDKEYDAGFYLGCDYHLTIIRAQSKAEALRRVKAIGGRCIAISEKKQIKRPA